MAGPAGGQADTRQDIFKHNLTQGITVIAPLLLLALAAVPGGATCDLPEPSFAFGASPSADRKSVV